MLQCDTGSFQPIDVRPCQFLTEVGLKIRPSSSKSYSKTDPICSHETILVSSRPWDIIQVGLISDATEWYWLLLAHWCQAMQIFDSSLLKIGPSSSKSDSKSDTICGDETILVTSRPLDIINMGLISDATVWYWLLLARWCQAMPIFDSSWTEN